MKTMNHRIFSRLVVATIAIALTGCGGGSGDETTVSTAPVASTTTFQLKSANDNFFNTTGTATFSVSGTVNGATVTGTGTATRGNVSAAVFETVAGFKRSTTVSASLTANGVTAPLTSTSTSFRDAGGVPLGTSGEEYVVITGAVTIPITARINDTGTAYTANRFSNSSKATLLGTLTSTYVLLPDTETTGLLKITDTLRNTAGTMTSQSTVTIRITAAGGLTFINETGVDFGRNTNLTFTYL